MIKRLKESDALEKIILGFFILFLVSLNNSIFINQIGYFGALLFLIVKIVIERRNSFAKSGLEIYFLLFLLAEIVSAIFSEFPLEAFRNVFKRAALIPIFYVTAFVFKEKYSLLNGVRLYLAAALLTILAYLIFAYEHFSAQLYQIETKGPSPFQYVMTAGGLISFVVIFLFAQLFNKENGKKIAAGIVVLLIISSASLIASYTRAAWLGAMVGILVVVLLNKKWRLLVSAGALIAVFLISFPNKSKLVIHEFASNKFSVKNELPTDGKISSLAKHDSIIVVADNNKVVKAFSIHQKKFEKTFPAVIVSFYKWHENYFIALSVEGRFFLVKHSNSKLNIVKEFISPGLTSSFAASESFLFVADIDSGVSIFNRKLELVCAKKLEAAIAISQFANSVFIAQRNIGITQFNFNSHKLDSISFYPARLNAALFMNVDSILFVATDKGIYSLEPHGIKDKLKKMNDDLTNVVGSIKHENKYLFISKNGEVHSFDLTSSKMTKENYTLEAPAVNAMMIDSFLVTSVVKSNRLLSIVDPNHLTNIQRINQWKVALKAASDAPLTGVGDIDMKDVYAMHKPNYEKENFGHFHNNYFHMLAALGFVGGLIFLFMIFSILSYHYKTFLLVRKDETLRVVSIASLASFVGFMVSGLAEFNFGDHEIITVVWFLLGIQFALRNINHRFAND